ncbi:hypothetical protein D1872_164420 [compost metagenome]
MHSVKQVGVGLGAQGSGVCPEEQGVTFTFHMKRKLIFVHMHRHLLSDEERIGLATYRTHVKPNFWAIGIRMVCNHECIVSRFVIPAHIIKANFEQGRHREQAVFPLDSDIDALTGCLGNIERITRVGDHFIEIGIADHKLGIEHPVHIGGGCNGFFLTS